MRSGIHVESRTTVGGVTRDSLDALCSDAGTGALTEQHEAFGAAATLGMLSSIFIWSQRDFVCGVAHSAILEEKIAQAERGTGPNPTKLSAKTKMNDRRTVSGVADRSFRLLSWQILKCGRPQMP